MKLALSALLLDFDGVLTDDRVWVDQTGLEMVCCSRRDGLAVDVLKSLHIKMFIISTEKNPVVKARAQKLQIESVQGSFDKARSIKELAENNDFSLANALYVGNDINDIEAMKICGYSACPSDAHPTVTTLAKYQLKTCGGQGVVREIVEEVLGIDIVLHWNSLVRPRTDSL